MDKPITINEWVLKCLVAENLDREQSYQHARKTAYWPVFEARIVVKGWNAQIDEAKRAMKIKLKTGSDALHQLEFDIMYAVEDGSLKETRRLNLYEFRYLIEVRRKQNRDDSARLEGFKQVYRILSSWWENHPENSLEDALSAVGIQFKQDDRDEGEEGSAAA